MTLPSATFTRGADRRCGQLLAISLPANVVRLLLRQPDGLRVETHDCAVILQLQTEEN